MKMKTLKEIVIFSCVILCVQFIYSQNTLNYKSAEIHSIKKIDCEYIVINNNSIKKYDTDNNVVAIDFQNKKLFDEYINDFFISKKKNIYKSYKRTEGYRYSENETLMIVLKYNCDQSDVYLVEMAKNDYKIELSSEFNNFLRLIYKW